MSSVTKLPPVKQRVCGHELRGKAFITNPTIIEFKDFVPGQIYKKRIEVTNCSLTFNTFKIEPMLADVCDIFDVEWSPVGRMSAGMKTHITVIFKPQTDADVFTYIPVATTTGPERFEIACHSKKLDLEFTPPVKLTTKRRRPKASPPDPFNVDEHPDAPADMVYTCKFDLGKVAKGSQHTSSVVIKNLGARESPFFLQLLSVREHARRRRMSDRDLNLPSLVKKGVDPSSAAVIDTLAAEAFGLENGLPVREDIFSEKDNVALRPGEDDHMDQEEEEEDEGLFSEDDAPSPEGLSQADLLSTGREGARSALPKRVGSTVGEVSLPRARGAIGALTTLEIPFTFTALKPGRIQVKLKVDFQNLALSMGLPQAVALCSGAEALPDGTRLTHPLLPKAPSFELVIRAECIEEPIFAPLTDIWVGTVIEGRVSKDNIELRNRNPQGRNVSLQITPEVEGLGLISAAEMKQRLGSTKKNGTRASDSRAAQAELEVDDGAEVRLMPSGGVVQGLKSFFVGVKLNPGPDFLTRFPDLRDVPATKRLHDLLSKVKKGPVFAECFKIPLKFLAAGQDLPIEVTLKGAITRGSFEISVSRMQFGRVELGCMSHCELSIRNPASLPMKFKFPWMPKDLVVSYLPDHAVNEHTDLSAYQEARRVILAAHAEFASRVQKWESARQEVLDTLANAKKKPVVPKGVDPASFVPPELQEFDENNPKPVFTPPPGCSSNAPRSSSFGEAADSIPNFQKWFGIDPTDPDAEVALIKEETDAEVAANGNGMQQHAMHAFARTQQFLGANLSLTESAMEGILAPGETRRLTLSFIPNQKGFLTEYVAIQGFSNVASLSQALPAGQEPDHKKVLVCEGRAVTGSVNVSERYLSLEPVSVCEKSTRTITLTNSANHWQEVSLIPPKRKTSKLHVSPKHIILPPGATQEITFTFAPVPLSGTSEGVGDGITLPMHPSMIAKDGKPSSEGLSEFAEEILLRQAAVTAAGGCYRVGKSFDETPSQSFKWQIPVIRRKIHTLPGVDPVAPCADPVLAIGTDPTYGQPRLSFIQARTAVVPTVFRGDLRVLNFGDVNVCNSEKIYLRVLNVRPKFVSKIEYQVRLPEQPEDERRCFSVRTLKVAGGEGHSSSNHDGGISDEAAADSNVVTTLHDETPINLEISFRPDAVKFYNSTLQVNLLRIAPRAQLPPQSNTRSRSPQSPPRAQTMSKLQAALQIPQGNQLNSARSQASDTSESPTIPDFEAERKLVEGLSQLWWNFASAEGADCPVTTSRFTIPIRARGVAPSLVINPADGVVDMGAVMASFVPNLAAEGIAKTGGASVIPPGGLKGEISRTVLVENNNEFAITVKVKRDLPAPNVLSSGSQLFPLMLSPTAMAVPPKSSAPIALTFSPAAVSSGLMRERVEVWAPSQSKPTYLYLHMRATQRQAWVDYTLPASKFDIPDRIDLSEGGDVLASRPGLTLPRAATSVFHPSAEFSSVENLFSASAASGAGRGAGTKIPGGSGTSVAASGFMVGAGSVSGQRTQFELTFPSPVEMDFMRANAARDVLSRPLSPPPASPGGTAKRSTSPGGKSVHTTPTGPEEPRQVRTLTVGCALPPTVSISEGSQVTPPVGSAVNYDFTIDLSSSPFATYFSVVGTAKGTVAPGQSTPVEFLFQPPASSLAGGSDFMALGAIIPCLQGVGRWVTAKAKGVLAGGLGGEQPLEVSIILKAFLPSV